MRGIDGLAIKLGEKNVRDGVEDGLGRAFKQIGEAGEDFALAKADGGVERSEAPEAHMDGRHGRARAKGAVLVLKNGDDVGGHGKQNNRERQGVMSGTLRSLRFVAVLVFFVGMGFEVGVLIGADLLGLIGEIADAVECLFER